MNNITIFALCVILILFMLTILGFCQSCAENLDAPACCCSQTNQPCTDFKGNNNFCQSSDGGQTGVGCTTKEACCQFSDTGVPCFSLDENDVPVNIC